MNLFDTLLTDLTRPLVDARDNPGEGLMMLACLAMGIDGSISSMEWEAARGLVTQLHAFGEYEETEVDDRMRQALGYIEEHGVDVTLDLIGDELPTEEDRARAFQLTAYILASDDRFTREENRLLERLAARFGLSAERVSTLLENLWETVEEVRQGRQ